jgi:arylsulfatase A-like enzyme
MVVLRNEMEIAIEMIKRPNILFIHVDQMHFQTMSAYGNPHVKTPVMDWTASDS